MRFLEHLRMHMRRRKMSHPREERGSCTSVNNDIVSLYLLCICVVVSLEAFTNIALVVVAVEKKTVVVVVSCRCVCYCVLLPFVIIL